MIEIGGTCYFYTTYEKALFSDIIFNVNNT